MPVRKIPKNYLGVTGSFSSKKNDRMLGFESLLERDYMILLEFDEAVETFEEQPVKIPFKKGVKPYVPDILINYTKARRPVLAEVKHTSDLQKNNDKYAPKFKVAKAYANNREWQFRIVTEGECRPPHLRNLKFLREYLRIDPDNADVARVIDAMQEAGRPIPMDEFLDQLCGSETERLILVPIIWHLVARNCISISLDIPITDKTILSLKRPSKK